MHICSPLFKKIAQKSNVFHEACCLCVNLRTKLPPVFLVRKAGEIKYFFSVSVQ
jgi:hypothetical protein